MPYVLATLLFKMLGCCCQCFIVVVTVWECLLCSDNLFMKILPECRTFQFSCWYWGKKFWCTCVEISLDLVQKVFLFSLTFLDDSIICNDSVFLVRWCKWTELAQEKRYLNLCIILQLCFIEGESSRSVGKFNSPLLPVCSLSQFTVTVTYS